MSLVKVFLWVNSGEEPNTWLLVVNNLQKDGKLLFDPSLQSNIKRGKECLGIEVDKDNIGRNPTAKIVSCSEQFGFFCVREISPLSRTKFPCIPRKFNIRKKRRAKGERIIASAKEVNGKY